ncbi:lipopolysaccharide biosynthesis protein [Nonomuraea sp. LPB2021202275-12-8]|uniref:lipopolysaccharide biosynthesis protein n=1 Tax=Nonomuraea sp. LPB2021202275-12-8 TaxID=3120159 RepID=UPI00300CF8ED
MSDLRRRLLRDLRNPLFRNGYALMANTGITAVLGMGYWLLAAHYFSEEEFGRGQALITLMRLFASLTALGLVGALARFLPVAGRRTPGLILRGYGIAAATGGAAAVGFLLTLPLWGETYSVLAGFGPSLFFLAAVMVWAVFTLQDVALTGLRQATWVPLNSVVFGLVKMGLLVALAGSLPDGGIFVSWMVPTAIALIPINWLIFGFVVPRHVRQTAGTGQNPPGLREVGRFLAGDFPGTLSVLAIVYLVPVVVAMQVGEATFGRFSMAHTLGCMIELLAMNMAVSLTVEGSFDPSKLAANCRNALRRALLIIVPIIVVTVVVAPFILHIFGAKFAEEGTMLLRLMALAVLPRVLIEIYLSALRARSEARALAFVQIGLAALVLASIAVLFPFANVNAVGYGMLLSETLVALLIFGKLRKILKYGETRQPSVAQGSHGAA